MGVLGARFGFGVLTMMALLCMVFAALSAFQPHWGHVYLTEPHLDSVKKQPTRGADFYVGVYTWGIQLIGPTTNDTDSLIVECEELGRKMPCGMAPDNHRCVCYFPDASASADQQTPYFNWCKRYSDFAKQLSLIFGLATSAMALAAVGAILSAASMLFPNWKISGFGSIPSLLILGVMTTCLLLGRKAMRDPKSLCGDVTIQNNYYKLIFSQLMLTDTFYFVIVSIALAGVHCIATVGMTIYLFMRYRRTRAQRVDPDNTSLHGQIITETSALVVAG